MIQKSVFEVRKEAPSRPSRKVDSLAEEVAKQAAEIVGPIPGLLMVKASRLWRDACFDHTYFRVNVWITERRKGCSLDDYRIASSHFVTVANNRIIQSSPPMERS